MKETERVLWRLLSVSTDETLSTAFSAEVSDQIPERLSVGTLGTTEEKKSAIVYWEQFPLLTANDARVWKQDLDSAHDSVGSHFDRIPGDDPLRQLEPDAGSQTETTPSGADGDVSLLPDAEDNIVMGIPPQGSVVSPPMNQSSPIDSIGQVDAFVPGNQQQALQQQPRSVATSKFGLSKEFQATFLW